MHRHGWCDKDAFSGNLNGHEAVRYPQQRGRAVAVRNARVGICSEQQCHASHTTELGGRHDGLARAANLRPKIMMPSFRACAASFVRDSPHLTNAHPELQQRINNLLDRIDEEYSKEELDDLFNDFQSEVLDANIAKTREEGLSPFDLKVNIHSIQL